MSYNETYSTPSNEMYAGYHETNIAKYIFCHICKIYILMYPYLTNSEIGSPFDHHSCG